MNIEEPNTDEITIDDLTEEQKLNALLIYVRNLNKLRQYNKKNKEQINEKAKQSFQKIKQNPELYEAYKQRKKETYRTKHPK